MRYWLASLTSFMADRMASFLSDVGRFSAFSNYKHMNVCALFKIQFSPVVECVTSSPKSHAWMLLP